MIELLFVACLVTAPDGQGCRERSMLFSDITPQMCLMGAQPELAKWVSTHPNFRIASWKCRRVSVAESDI